MSRPSHIQSLDGVRGLAIFAVMIFHALSTQGIMPVRVIEKVYFVACGLGWAGVDLFFVLSGFLITRILLATREDPNYLKNFFGRRVLRIFPLYYLFLVVALFLVGPSVLESVQAQGLIDAQVWYWLYFQNWMDWFGARPAGAQGIEGHLWSLAIEEQFYLFWPFVVLAFSRKNLIRVCAAIILIVPISRIVGVNLDLSYDLLYRFTFFRLDCLALGALLAASDGVRQQFAQRFVPYFGLAAVALLVVGILSSGFGYATPGMQTAGYSINALLAGLLVAVCAEFPEGKISSLFDWKPARVLGKYSYSMYVVHWPIMSVLGRHWREWMKDVNPVVSHLLFLGVTTALSLVLALATWHGFERHFLKMKKHFDYRKES